MGGQKILQGFTNQGYTIKGDIKGGLGKVAETFGKTGKVLGYLFYFNIP